MPEGPEALINAQYVRKRFKGWSLDAIESNTKTKRDVPTKSILVDVYSKGKVIVLQTSSFYLHIHLGISGWLVPRKPRIYKYALTFSNKNRKSSSTIYIKDRRRFSSINVYTKEEHDVALHQIGVDILSADFTLDYFQSILVSRKRNICALLMDQTLCAGLGNYIKNEALYLAKVSPLRKSNDLQADEINALWKSIRWVSFSNVLSWFEDYNIRVPAKIKARCPSDQLLVPYMYFVYNREKDRKGNPVKFIKSCGGRRTYYVPKLQK